MDSPQTLRIDSPPWLAMVLGSLESANATDENWSMSPLISDAGALFVVCDYPHLKDIFKLDGYVQL